MVCRAISHPPRDRNQLLKLINLSTALSHLNQTHAHLILNGPPPRQHRRHQIPSKTPRLQSSGASQTPLRQSQAPDLFLYNALIKGLRDTPFDSLSLYNTLLRKSHLKPDNFTYSFLISAFSRSSSPVSQKVAVLLHGHAVVSGFGSDVFVGSALVDAYTRFSKFRQAHKVFDEIPEPDTVLWNTLLSGLVKNSRFDESLAVFGDMIRRATRLDSTTLAVVLSAVAELQRFRDGMLLQALAIKVGCHFDKHVLTCLVSLYSKCGDVSTARLLFELIGRPDSIAYNAMISGLSCNGEAEQSLQLFQELLSSEHGVSSSSVVGLIPVFHPFGRLDLTQTIHGLCIKSGFTSNSPVSTALTTVYSRLNELHLARSLFDELPDKPLASWNAMISGYAQNGHTEKAISLFHEMQELDIRPNPVTITSILSACAQLGALGLGKWLHRLIEKECLEPSIYISTALIDMYMKCGSVEEARKLFDAMVERNAVTWNAIISGYGLHGDGKEALRLYREMQEAGIPPTGVTHLSVLYACSHAGLVEEGERMFRSMIHDHGFEPKSEHYACMVDILGRGGRLEEAVEFITNKMHFAPGPAQWGALLGACMVHKNTKLARLASARLFEMEPENIGYHVLLSNIHSTNSNFSEAASLRQVVRRKTPGCTLIEVKGRAHVFTSSDRSHPQSGEIYATLERVMGKMKDEGYQAETVMALHDVEEEEKELMLKFHGEKLAIAFGLMMCEDGDEIRIIKNLRVCLDCHNFTKFVSKISGRKLTVRDANRFHHFQHGECSCGDYW
uniref:Pentatricopeptide repeat protein n=1 Tax=Salvia miltiorrhiza TaxID=226208 RepID=A0A678WCQ7_SALMI|nr:pentatricopeptide repeat protein [Salvia miltiorrhiza]